MDKFSIGLIIGVIVMGLFSVMTQYDVKEDDDEVKALIDIHPKNCSTDFDTRDYIKNHELDIDSFVKDYYQYCR